MKLKGKWIDVLLPRKELQLKNLVLENTQMNRLDGGHTLPLVLHFGVCAVLKMMESTKKLSSVGDNPLDYRIFGPYTRDLHVVFKIYANEDRIKRSDLRKAFHDLNLYPSHSQIQEMVHCAVEYGSPCAEDHVTFGEFCVLVDELRHHYEFSTQPPLPKSFVKKRSSGSSVRRLRKESLANFQVFLGGSCGDSKNASTWRHDLVIPFLKKESITFYNPQVNNWRPELIELEDRAKCIAELLFFVIDNKNRSIVSLSEIAYLVGGGRPIFVVFNEFQGKVEKVCDEPLSQREKEDIQRARNVLVDLVERNSIPVFENIEAALNCVRLHLKQAMKLQDLTLKHGAIPVKHGHTLLGEALLKLRESFNSIVGTTEGQMSKEDFRLGYRCYTGQDFSVSWLHQQRPQKQDFSFEEFCAIVTEFKRRRPSLAASILSKVAFPFSWLAAKMKGSIHPDRASEEEIYDVYLGGSCGENNWRDDIAVPLLKRAGVSYLNPSVTLWSDHLIPMQTSEREKCHVLFYVIADHTRAIGGMVEASYYIGKGCRVILCLEELNSNATIAGEQISDNALRDYSRGRAYLSDLCSREGVPVFEKITASLECVIKTIKEISQGAPL